MYITRGQIELKPFTIRVHKEIEVSLIFKDDEKKTESRIFRSIIWCRVGTCLKI